MTSAIFITSNREILRRGFINLFMIKIKIMVHDKNSCSRCRPLVEMLEKDTVTAQELEELRASKGVNFDGDDKGREIEYENVDRYVLFPGIVCPEHHSNDRTITFEKISDEKYKRA
jgi:hypothetical protein